MKLRRSSLSTLVALAILIACGTPRAEAADCRAAKLSAAGKYTKSVLDCSSKATKKGTGLDYDCPLNAAMKLDAAYAKAGSGCSGTAVATNGRATTATGELVAGILPGWYAGVDQCASAQFKAAAKYASAVLKAEAKFLTTLDSAKRTESIAKAVLKVNDAFTAAASEYSCTGTLTSGDARAELDALAASVLGCVVDGEDCDGAGGTLFGGGSITTDSEGDNATATDPIETTVNCPWTGTLAIVESPAGPPPVGFEVLGNAVQITAPPATTAAPLQITFVLDASEVVGHVPADLFVARDGVPAADCTGLPGEADPDPCVTSRTMLGDGDFSITALSSAASPWIVGVSAGCPTSMIWRPQAYDGVIGARSDVELGWTGYTHNLDPADGFPSQFALDCYGAPGPNCGTCAILEWMADTRTCRCAGNTRTICDEPSAADLDDCGGAQCDCYVQPPWPVHAAGTPACLTRRFTDAIGGLWAPNTGSGFIEFKERLSVYIGIEPFQSCPTCEGDAVPNDGVRGGTCNGGPDNGLSCDVQGTDQAIDAGAGLSLDCFPDPLKNITGPSGVQLHVSFTTGALSLPSVETCDGPLAFLPCPCGVCSGDTSQACHTDTDCFGLGLGTCGAGDGNAAPRTPNSCSDLQCSDSGINELGVCNGDPPDMYCDATVRTDGSGILPCLTDVDCDAFGLICGGADCGNCTLAEKRRCFLDPIDATGVPHSTAPTLVAMTCIAQTTNVAVNAAMGLPGPTRLTLESTVAYEQ